MANESKIAIKGNFIVISDITTNDEFIRGALDMVTFHRTATDDFIFSNNSPTINAYGSQGLNILGVNALDPIDTAKSVSRTVFPFATIVDYLGVAFSSADVLDVWLSDNLGIIDRAVVPNTNLAGSFSKTFTALTSISVAHGLGSFPNVNVLNSLNKVVIPLTITHTSVNVFVVTFSVATTGTIIATLGIGADSVTPLLNRVLVTQSNYLTTICGVIDSTKEYFLDGIVNIGASQITIPTTGITINGYSFDLSGLTSSQTSYTMFISQTPSIGSGNIVMSRCLITVSGVGSKVFEVYDSNGFHTIEFNAINYIDCTSLGDLHDYRQGLEIGTGRIGVSPSLTLHGTWLGGFRIVTSITRDMSDITTEPLFKAGTAFVMNSRFRTDMNVDLGTLQPLLDFTPSNFPNPSTLQLRGMEIKRDGVYDPTDTNITPNISNTDLPSSWNDNNGINNTYIGGLMTLATEIVTPIAIISTYYSLLGTFTASDLQHFSSPANGQLKNLGINPREFKIITYIVLQGTANDVISIRLRRYNSLTLATTTISSQQATVNNLSGGTDRCTFSILGNTPVNQNDYYFIEVSNETGARDVTALLGTFSTIEER